jgi:pimeloyl-ACP methyl ester carboxylesterase
MPAMKDTPSINDRSILTSDGTRIAYRVEGSGPALVLTNGLTTTTTFWKYLRPIWLRRHTVVTWDLPGHGASSPAATQASTSVEAQAQIVTSVMRAAEVERAFQIGWSTGTQVVLEVYRQFPERCLGLAMLLGPAEHVLDTARLPIAGKRIQALMQATPGALFAPICRVMAASMNTAAGHLSGRAFGLIGPAANDADVREMTQHIASVDPRSLRWLLLAIAANSGADVLAKLRVQLLIVSGDKDPFAPSDLVGVPMHRLAPGSELVRLAEGTHTALLEQPVVIGRAVESFIAHAMSGASRVNGR